jgi:hypothetical protein
MLTFRIFWLTAIVILLAGCECMSGANSVALNQALNPTAQYAAWVKSKTDNDRPSSCFNLEGGTTCLLPGMKMQVQQISGLSVGNTAVPIVTSFDWIIPEPNALTRNDLFVLGYLMTAAHPGQKSGNASECYEAWLNRSADFADEFYLPLLKHMSVNWDMIGQPGTPSAVSVQNWMRWAPTSSYTDGATWGQELVFEIPAIPAGVGSPAPSDVDCANTVTFTAFDHGSAWQELNDDQAKISQVQPAYPPNAPFYRTNNTISNPRSLILIAIPISIDGVSGYVPIDSSVADLERTEGVEVTSINRTSSLAPVDASVDSGVPRFDIVLTPFKYVLKSANTIYMPRACVGDILLAPGDEVTLSGTSTSATGLRNLPCEN